MEISTLYPAIEPGYLMAEKAAAGTACVLSILGALLVIFSFLYESETKFNCKEVYYKLCCGYRIRETLTVNGYEEEVTKYRIKSYHYILIHLSVADILVAASHIWGLCSSFEKRFHHHIDNGSIIEEGFDTNCITQAAFTVVSTMASFFWTDILVVFLVFNIVFQGCSNNFWTGLDKVQKSDEEAIDIPSQYSAPNCCESPFFLHMLFPIIGWGLPLIMVVIFALLKLLGFTLDYDQGWCYFYLNSTMSYHQRSFIIDMLGYELWLWLSIILVLLCTITYSITACMRRSRNRNYRTNCTEFRYLCVGVVFTLLRVPSTAINLYLMRHPQNYQTAATAVLNIIACCTDSLQGALNGIIYLCCRTGMKERCCLKSRGGYHRLK